MCLSNLTELDTDSTNGVRLPVCPNNGKCNVFVFNCCPPESEKPGNLYMNMIHYVINYMCACLNVYGILLRFSFLVLGTSKKRKKKKRKER